MFDKSQIMKEAHKRTRQEMRDFPKLYAGYNYAAVFALCLRGAWRDAKAGKFSNQKFEKRERIRNKVLRVQMKTRMSPADFVRVTQFHHELRSI
ncbi:hypothetical protein [Roseibium sp.]|uniref:hypothetical protein n=1 Tax=Roseibium sp. TaxID=1936156 RepID=UPI003B502AF3